MSNQPQFDHDPLYTSQLDLPRAYATLKQSLSASLATDPARESPLSTSLPKPLAENHATKERNVPAQCSTDQSSTTSTSASTRDVALAALKYLPTPVLVLSSLKKVVLANEAMGRLLGIENSSNDLDESGNEMGGESLLRGQTLSQIGVDILQGGQPIWVSWDKFLDGLADEMNQAASLSAIPTAARPDQLRRVRDAVVEVIISSLHINPSESQGSTIAKMVISIWSLADETYFTLTFTSDSTPVSRPASRTSHHSPTQGSFSPASSASSPHGSKNHAQPVLPKATLIPLASTDSLISLFPSLREPNRLDAASTPSVLLRTLRMKDAILNSMEIPAFAMWRDQSLVFPNKSLMQLTYKPTDATSDDAYDFLSRFKVYTQDFERLLTPDEYPIVELCRTQKPFKSWRVGMIDQARKRYVFDVSGECIFDEKTGEFLAGLIMLKDVTAYTDMIKIQSEENDQQFQLICDTMPQMLWTATSGGLHDWFSKRWYDYTGLTPAQSLGSGWLSTIHSDDIFETEKRWSHCLTTGNEYSIEYRCMDKNGGWRWMLGRASPLKDQKTGRTLKWFGGLTDIHDLVEARQSARRTREQLLNVVKHSQVTLWAVDRERRLTCLEGKLMWDESERDVGSGCLGQDIYEVFARHKGAVDLPLYKQPIEAILNGSPNDEINEHHIDGNGRWFRTRFIPILSKRRHCTNDDESFVDGVVGVSMDVTEIKEREAELQSRQAENSRLLSAETAAKEASRLKSQFLANMSHEIRTPIAGVIGMAELLTDTELDDEQRECAENIQRSANGLLTVINDILDLSKVESGRLDIEEVQFSLSVVIRDVSKMLSYAAERKKLSFDSDIKIGVDRDLIVVGDPGRVRQILTNLLTNSIKFTSEGFVKLSAEVSHETDDSIEVFFSVEDTGIGIEEDVQKRLFKPFSQADSSTARRYGGTGLGLTICKNLVDLMHGKITLNSVLGTGTKAIFSLPFSKPQFRKDVSTPINLQSIPDRLMSETSMSNYSDPEQHSNTPPQSSLVAFGTSKIQGQPSSSSRSPRVSAAAGIVDSKVTIPEPERKRTHILVVEDNAINQQIATKTIKKLGFSVSAVWNGQEALDYLLADSAPDHIRPDVILMDVQMPILDGYRATHLIRHHDPYSSLPGLNTIPIVAMTASAIQGDKEKCERAGMDDYLAKPVKAEALEKMLVKWAFHQERAPRKSETSSSQNADHDSNCVDSDLILPATERNQVPIRMNEHKSHALEIVDRSRLRGVESEGDRGLRRVAAEEKAISLRDDKFLIAAGEPNPEHQRTASRVLAGTVSSRPKVTTTALTEENMERLDREHGNSDSVPQAGSPSAEVDGSSGASSVLDAGESSQGTARSRSVSANENKRAKGILNRNESNWSQHTIRAQTSTGSS